MYNEDLGYLYAKDNTSGNLDWRTTASSYWTYKNSNWFFNSNSALLRTYGQSSFRTYGTNYGETLIMAHKISDATTTYIYMPPLEAVATPTFMPNPGDYTSPQDIIITCSTDNADIYYTTDETEPTTESTLYTAGATGLHYDADVTFKAIAIKAGMENSEVATGIFHINPNKTADTTATACGSFTWHGTTYYETPAVAPTFTDHTTAGYDSVITLHLTIYPTPTVNIISEPNQDFLCEGESMVLSLDGIRETHVLLNEDFSSCTGQESNEISPLTTFPTLSKIFPTASGNEVKMGSGSYIGKLTSATLDLSSPFIVTLSAKRYSATENGPIQVTVNGVTKSIATLSENYQTYTLEFDAATAHSTITIATTTASMRAYLNAVNITVPGAGILWSTGEETSSITVTPNTTTNYEVVVEDDNSCLGYANRNVTVYETPVAAIEGPANDMLCPNGTKIFTAQHGDETQYTYQWYKDNVKIEGATHSTYTLDNVSGTMSGDYTVVVKTLSGLCQDSSAAVHFVVNEPADPDYVFSLSAPADIYDTIHVGYCEVTHTFVHPTATHYLDGTPLGEVAYVNDLHATSHIYDTPGDYTINWTGTDACGNTATCTQVLHIAYEPCPTAVDNDRNTYESVRINCECWTTTSLKSTTYSDGSNINDVMSYQSDEHPNAEANSNLYGQLYTWHAAVAEGNAALNTPNHRGHIQGVCPAGWYLPTTDQILGLLNTYTMSNIRYNNYWLDGGGDNISGLSLVPGGMYNAGTDRFENLGGNCYLWSAYEYDESTAKTFEADCYCGSFKVYNNMKDTGYSVRCIKERQ
ncbi:MAG: chitobiase/beta-hexosaminidase C-terminal domain-containing protein [Bacteroidales bacterium]|nr:chitobiase/beta-hexosaminidase C-terminal domain-containing protein [Bacteroidales bacterium]